MKTSRVLGLVTPLVLGMLMGSSLCAHAAPPAPPPIDKVIDKAACLDAVQKGQTLRDGRMLVEARDQFRVCARAECPEVVRADCTTWVGELDAAMPTVVLAAKDAAGKDVVDVEVSADGQAIARTLDGGPVAVDPGMHTFRFARADGSTATQPVLVNAGEKLKAVGVVLSAPVPVSDVGATPPPSSSPPTSMSTQRLAAYVVGGAGIVAVGVGIGVAFAAKGADNDAKNETGPARVSDSASAVSEGTAATVVMGVGAAMAAAGVVLWLTAPKAKAAVGVGASGRAVLLQGSF
jgi:hypothetical protein